MGWWSATVLGGDGPLDHLDTMSDLIGGRFSDDDEELARHGGGDHCNIYTREQVETCMSRLVDHCKGAKWDSDIAFHVLGHMILTTGAAMSEEVRSLIIKAIQSDTEWRDEADCYHERAAFMHDFAQKIMAHRPGDITIMSHEGLIEKILSGERAS